MAWHEQHVDPIVHALYRQTPAVARELLAQAVAALPGSQLSREFTQMTQYRLHYTAFQIAMLAGKGQELDAALQSALDGLAEPAISTLAASTRARLLLQTLIIADTNGIRALGDSEFDLLFANASRHSLNAELWFFVSGWAFLHQRREIVVQAMEFMTIHAAGYQSDFVWQRVHLMQLLLDGCASQRDVLELIRRFEHPHQWDLTARQLWPACQAAGLVDEKVEQALAARLAAISFEPPPLLRRDLASRQPNLRTSD